MIIGNCHHLEPEAGHIRLHFALVKFFAKRQKNLLIAKIS